MERIAILRKNDVFSFSLGDDDVTSANLESEQKETLLGAAVVEWFAEQMVRGSNPCLISLISEIWYLLLTHHTNREIFCFQMVTST